MASTTSRWTSPAAALVLLALCFLATVRAADPLFIVVVKGYRIAVSDFALRSTLEDKLTSTPWFNDVALAKDLAEAGKDILGYYIQWPPFSGPKNVGPTFITSDPTAEGISYWNFGGGGPFYISPSFPATLPSWFTYYVPDPPIEEWRTYDPVTSSVLWVPQTGLDCRATCANMFMLAVSAFKPTEATPNPPLLCAAIGTLYNDPSLTVPGSLADDPYRFFLSEGYTQPIPANSAAGLPAQFDPNGCSSYLDGTTPNAQNYLCGCVPPRKSANGTPQKPWRWVPASTDDCNSGDAPFDGYFVPFVCRVRATGLIGHLNTQNCGFPSADEMSDCAFGQLNKQPASRFPAALNMPAAKPDFPDCVYATRAGVQGSTQEIAGWNSVDKLCIASSFKYFVYRWAKDGPRPKP